MTAVQLATLFLGLIHFLDSTVADTGALTLCIQYFNLSWMSQQLQIAYLW